MSQQHKESGAAHIAAIAIIIVIAGAGFAGWWVWHKNQDKNKVVNSAQQAVADALKNAKCTYSDADLCKAFESMKLHESYALTSTSKESDGTTSTSVIEVDGANKSHIKISGATSYETIFINDTLYTKAGDTWYKQTVPQSDASKYKDSTTSSLPQPAASSTDTTADTAVYTKVGKEACGNLTCFHYKVTETDGTVTNIWFDDQDYQIRRIQTEGDTPFDATFTYDNVKVSAPSPVKDLQPGQYIVPGQSEPVSVPSGADYNIGQ